MERNYRPPHPRFLAWKGSLHSGSLPSAKHNRSISHCELTSHQFISSTRTCSHRVLSPVFFAVYENKRRKIFSPPSLLLHLHELLSLESTSVIFALLRKSKFSIQIYIYDVLCILCILGKIKAKNFNRYLYRFLSIDFVSTNLQIVVSSRCTRG